MTCRALNVEVADLEWAAAGIAILRGITLRINPGIFAGIVGPNGSGKSSLLRCIYRLYRPTAGQVLLNGRDIWEMTARECARQTAVVVQESVSDFGLTVQEVVLMGRTPHKGLFDGDSARDLRLIEEALTLMGMSNYTERRFETLSGGEKQRVLIARAIAQQPRLLILDEPTNHLDIRFQFEVLRIVKGLGVTVLAAIHDLNLAASFCDHVHVLQQGRLVAEGRPQQVFTSTLIHQVFDIETIVDTHPVTAGPRITFYHSHPQT